MKKINWSDEIYKNDKKKKKELQRKIVLKIANFTTKSISTALIVKKSQERKKIREIKLKKLQENNQILKERKIKNLEEKIDKENHKLRLKEEELKIREKEIKFKEEKQKIESERLIKKDKI